jgi:hypothetical protein
MNDPKVRDIYIELAGDTVVSVRGLRPGEGYSELSLDTAEAVGMGSEIRSLYDHQVPTSETPLVMLVRSGRIDSYRSLEAMRLHVSGRDLQDDDLSAAAPIEARMERIPGTM